ncbi:MAG: hypothetical protein CVT67_06535 [Actinobacteria bacterium HGW-Actinobacteria-7]|nr:MAG: hypothetical protein CVT67_06535 [Actinobacteria bacterium HGW-Actinobacteria-7]
MKHRPGILSGLSLATLTFLLVAGLAAPACAITRADVITRAKVWTDRNVPYSQSRYATVDGNLLASSTSSPQSKGYRTDCSGFVSMSLGFHTSSGALYSADTAGLGKLLVKITKDELRPGDVILRPKDLKINGVLVPYGHAIIFGGWANSSKTEYWCLHESSSAKGTVLVRAQWGKSGFFNEVGFAPYRYPGVRDRIRAPKTFGQ